MWDEVGGGGRGVSGREEGRCWGGDGGRVRGRVQLTSLMGVVGAHRSRCEDMLNAYDR